MNATDLQKLKELAQAATSGPWKRGPYGWVFTDIEPNGYAVACCESKSGYMRNSACNEEFIAAANPAAILELIALAERASQPTEVESVDTQGFIALLKDYRKESNFIGRHDDDSYAVIVAHLNADKAAVVAKAREEVAAHQQSHIDQLKAQLAGTDSMLGLAIKERDALLAARQAPDLRCVIHWLEGGCDPLMAAKELRAYQKQLGHEDPPLLAQPSQQPAPVADAAPVGAKVVAYVPVHPRTGEVLWANTIPTLDLPHPSYEMRPLTYAQPSTAQADVKPSQQEGGKEAASINHKLIDAAEAYAKLYEGDDRQDIATDVINSFYRGADWQRKQPSDKLQQASTAQVEPAKTEGCAGFQGKPVSTCGQCGGKGCDAEAASTTDAYGDMWHNLTCDGTCNPPCKDAPPASGDCRAIGEDEIEKIVRSYFAEPWSQDKARDAIKEAIAAATAVTPAQATLIGKGDDVPVGMKREDFAQAMPEGGQDERAEFEAWASDPVRSEKLPLDRWPTNGAYKDSRTYIAFYGWKSGRAALAASQQAAEPVLWIESEPSARLWPLSEVINGMCHTVIYHHRKPATSNPVWPLYDRAAPPQQEPDKRPLFERKLADLRQRGYEVIGRILHKDGEYALFDSSCRWLTKAQYQRLMHEQDGSLFATPPQQVGEDK